MGVNPFISKVNDHFQVVDVISKEKPTNIAHTPAELPFHMDDCYYESPPGLQFLHCIRYDRIDNYFCKIEYTHNPVQVTRTKIIISI